MPGCLLLLILLGVPAFDLWLLFRIGDRIGGIETVALVVLTTLVGLSLARRQRESAVRSMQATMSAGRMPTGAMADAPMLMLAALLFALPGFVTDALGLLLLVPPVRRIAFALIARRMLRAAASGRGNIRMFGGAFGAGMPGMPGMPGGAGGDGGDGSPFGSSGGPAGQAGPTGRGLGDSSDAGDGDAGGPGARRGPSPFSAPGTFEPTREVKELPPDSYRVRDPDASS